jgi:hypothetical protein
MERRTYNGESGVAVFAVSGDCLLVSSVLLDTRQQPLDDDLQLKNQQTIASNAKRHENTFFDKLIMTFVREVLFAQEKSGAGQVVVDGIFMLLGMRSEGLLRIPLNLSMMPHFFASGSSLRRSLGFLYRKSEAHP